MVDGLVGVARGLIGATPPDGEVGGSSLDGLLSSSTKLDTDIPSTVIREIFIVKNLSFHQKRQKFLTFRSQIFYVRKFRVIIFSSISRVHHIFATYNTIGK